MQPKYSDQAAMPITAPRRRRGFIALAIVLVFWAIVIGLLLQRQTITDWWRLRAYTPTDTVTALADQTAMTDKARRLFYINDPQIEKASSFNEHCRFGEYTIVLGCYIGGDGGIYVFAVDDERLSGIQEVTAAHEMLHAAYERLSGKERARVDRLTAQAFAGLKNERVRISIERYRAHDPAVVPNELHSILGTEVADLPDELEAYYKRYFTDRTRVVAFAVQYEEAFESRQAKIAEYEAQLVNLQARITERNEALEARANQLRAQRSNLESQRATLPPSGFNAQAAAFNAAVATYNAEIEAVGGLITTYNDIHSSYMAVVLEQQDLFKAIDSRPQAF